MNTALLGIELLTLRGDFTSASGVRYGAVMIPISEPEAYAMLCATLPAEMMPAMSI